ncbi:hypothetical protein P12x_005820 [Tundrisphaera lichenicola]|uniref:hypothetical protein n=1 Tax=Tundrisphaera lichenicola TaxID=2029860 RepID=UPI003EBD3BF1
MLASMMASTGCGPTARPSDPNEGRKALQAALEAWKGGEKPESLSAQTPSIHVADGDWASGHRLLDYRAVDEGRLVGSDLNYTVALELKGPRGKVIKKDAVYAVTTDPQLMVLRQDD